MNVINDSFSIVDLKSNKNCGQLMWIFIFEEGSHFLADFQHFLCFSYI